MAVRIFEMACRQFYIASSFLYGWQTVLNGLQTIFNGWQIVLNLAGGHSTVLASYDLRKLPIIVMVDRVSHKVQNMQCLANERMHVVVH